MLPKFEDTIFYEIYPNSFKDSNGDGYGDLKGIISKLDYIHDLGCNGIWLNPIFDSPFLDGGYDIRDFFKVSERFGSQEDLEALIEKCHQKGILLFLDLVPGHASIYNKEFLESAKPEKNEFSDLFIWNADPWVIEPGYRLISGMFQRNGCYMVNFFSHQPAINYGFNKVEYPWQHKAGSSEARKGKEFLESVMNYYLEMGVDGFRVDMADSLVKNDGDTKIETIKLWNEIRKDISQKHPHFLMTSEWSNPSLSFKAGFDSDFVLDHWDNCSHYLFRNVENGKQPLLVKFDLEMYEKFKKDLLWRLSQAKSYGKKLSFITGNHDTVRLANYLDDSQLRLAYFFILTMPGVPYIYAGDEIGLHADTTLESVEGGFHRTGSRTPMRFDSSKHAGFSTAERTFLPTNERDSTVEEMEKEPSSLLHLVKKLVSIRREEDDLRSDKFEFIKDETMCFRRGDIKVYMNITESDKTHDIDDGKVLIGTGPFKIGGSKLLLQPHSAVIVK